MEGNKDLKGASALVTGAGSGTGRAIALALAAAGANVTLMARREELLLAVGDEIRAAGGQALEGPGDVSSAEDIARVVKAGTDAHGPIDTLVNNAAWQPPMRPSHEVPQEELLQAWSVNTLGSFLLSREVIPQMQARGGGSIVNIATGAALRPLQYALAYSISKAAMVHMSKLLAAEYGKDGIRVNCICPGGIEDGSMIQLLSENDTALLTRAAPVAAPLPHKVRASEIADLVRFLVGPSASAMTGAVIPMDGGRSAQ